MKKVYSRFGAVEEQQPDNSLLIRAIMEGSPSKAEDAFDFNFTYEEVAHFKECEEDIQDNSPVLNMFHYHLATIARVNICGEIDFIVPKDSIRAKTLRIIKNISAEKSESFCKEWKKLSKAEQRKRIESVLASDEISENTEQLSDSDFIKEYKACYMFRA